jgi:transposase
LGSAQFAATETGYAALPAWLCSFGTLALVGIEGTGAYGAGPARHLHREGVPLVEIDRPDRKTRRQQGKSDRLRGLPSPELVKACAATRPDPSTVTDPATAVKIAPRSPARRHHQLTGEINELDQLIKPLIQAINPVLLQVPALVMETCRVGRAVERRRLTA